MMRCRMSQKGIFCRTRAFDNQQLCAESRNTVSTELRVRPRDVVSRTDIVPSSLYPTENSESTKPAMDQPALTIAVVRGASNAEIQDIFRALAERWQPELRLVGVVAEGHGLADRFCPAGYLRNLTTGARFSIFHDPGPGTAECHIDGVGAVAAAAAVQHDIATGCDLVMLNKFGQLEAAGDGLAGAFRAAVASGGFRLEIEARR